MPDRVAPRYLTLLGRALRLRCPRCGQGKLFHNWIQMPPECPACHLPFQREPGFYLGSIYVNYGLTGLLVALAYPALLFAEVASAEALLVAAALFSVLFPIWFFRYARAIWLAFDQYWDPPAENVAAR